MWFLSPRPVLQGRAHDTLVNTRPSNTGPEPAHRGRFKHPTSLVRSRSYLDLTFFHHHHLPVREGGDERRSAPPRGAPCPPSQSRPAAWAPPAPDRKSGGWGTRGSVRVNAGGSRT